MNPITPKSEITMKDGTLVKVPQAALDMAKMLLDLSPAERVDMLWKLVNYLQARGELSLAGEWADMAMEWERDLKADSAEGRS